MKDPKKYSIGNFILDVVLTACTGGIWLLYIIIRELRRFSGKK